MSRTTLSICAALAATLSLSLTAGSHAATTADQTIAFVDRAVAHIKEVGRDKAFADFSRADGGYVDGELYMFCYAADGTNLAHGGNPAFVGKNLMDLKAPDGKLVTAEVIHTGLEKGAGWVDTRWPNPVTKKVEAKSMYAVKVDGNTVCGSGYYKG
jgi:cytochrome c